MYRVGIVVPTLNAGENLCKLLSDIQKQTLIPEKIMIIDSGSIDKTIEIASQYTDKIVKIEPKNFNHGGTRQYAFELMKNDVDIIVFITQDIMLYDKKSLKNLVEVFKNEKVGAAYGRQISYANASLIAKQLRLFNYPDRSFIKSYKDKNVLGIKTAFLSDSFAAYRCTSLRIIGGFPLHVIVAEDMYVGAKLLLADYEIAYVSEAKVYHSHNYNLLQDFRRYFDTGVFQSSEKWIKDEFGVAESEGLKLVLFQLKYLWKNYCIIGIFKMLLSSFLKFVAYRFGMFERFLPKRLKKILSGQRSFWE